MTDTFVNEARVGGQDQNLTGDIIPPGGTGSVLPQSDFMGDVKEHDAKIGVVQGQLAGAAEKAKTRGSFVDDQAAARAETYQQEMEHSYSLERASANDPSLKPWNADKEHSDRVRGPIEQFGSLGTIFAMAASAFTRQPMVSALNAGAAAMTAMKNSDEEGYKHAFEAWKDNSQLAIKRFDMERTMFDDVNKLATSNMALWRQKRAAVATQFGDQQTLTLLQNGMDPEVLKLDAQQATTHGKLIENREQMLQMKGEQDIYDAHMKANLPNAKTQLEQLQVKAEAFRKVLDSRNKYGSHSLEQQYVDQRVKELVEQGASPTEAMSKANQEWKARPGSSQPTLAGEKAQVIEKAKAEFRAAHDGREPNAEESKEIVDKATQSNVSMTIGKMDAQEIARRSKEYEKDGMDKTAAYDQAKTEVMNKPTLTEEEASYMAKQYMQGDKSVLQNLGRGVQGQANLIYLRKKVVELAKQEGVSPAELATRMTEFSGMMAAQRTLGQRTANVELFNNEAINMMDIAQAKSREVPRTQFPSVNRALLAYERQTGDPNVRAFGAAINTVINTYAKAINGGSAGTVSDKDHAREILKDADTPEQFDAVMNILKQELQAARTAPGQVRQELRNLSGGGSTIEQGKVPPPQNVIRYDAQGNRI